MINWVRSEKLLAVLPFIYFFRFCRNFPTYLADNIEQLKSDFFCKRNIINENIWVNYFSPLAFYWSVSMEKYCLLLILFLHGYGMGALQTYEATLVHTEVRLYKTIRKAVMLWCNNKWHTYIPVVNQFHGFILNWSFRHFKNSQFNFGVQSDHIFFQNVKKWK